LDLFCGSGGFVVGVVVNVDLWEKQRRDFSVGFFHKSTFPFFYQLHFLRITFKGLGAFFLNSGG